MPETKKKLTNEDLNAMPLSKLLAIAVRDLRKFERTPGCVVDMGTWLGQRKVGCVGCMAGAVLREEFGRRRASCDHLPNWMFAINALRTGCVGAALDRLSRPWKWRLIGNHPLSRSVADYRADPEQFYRDMLKLQRDLEAAGL